ncbi:MAG: heavy metal translocating P-type ATPase metal-binding domain-containing protein [Bacteroidetes bacterium]|nr:heavy metal translocating P-type ATPase metal-binding domain-containing protein [Bacteroidota bacterium]MBS1539672.1 heavy metal translocating P-type ATPase metal-binding domain-containing protein [Bacteroidota bacterium]
MSWEAVEEKTQADILCYHCGQPCDEKYWLAEKAFCCQGCQTVYEILNANNLCQYYQLDRQPGRSQRQRTDENFLYLDERAIRQKLLSFDSDQFARITFSIPGIHCVSCIWLLENLQKMDAGILRAETNFAKKSVTIDFNPAQSKLSQIASLLHSLGYAPHITLDDAAEAKQPGNKSLVLKLAVAGFCFGNIMLFSFPEYLGISQTDIFLNRTFSWLNLLFALPVFLYSSTDYLMSAIKSFKQKQINIDVPIAAGLIALFFRSAYDIISHTGPGYFDSFAGLVFFLLIGRWFQSKTYESLAFDRDFKSYFPLAVQRKENTEWKSVVIYQLVPGDLIQLRNMEIVPADSRLVGAGAFIDYSFVTGESRPVKANADDLVYAGGRLIGQPVKLVVEKSVSQSHLTSLWNNPAFGKVNESRYKKMIDRAARRFTWIVMGVALLTAVYWQIATPARMWLVLTSVLMVACPCALALAAPFTFGNVLRVFGKHKLYLKNADVVERLAAVNTVVLDKTGTVTHGEKPTVEFVGKLTDEERQAISTLTSASSHPLSTMIAQSLGMGTSKKISDFKEIPGSGIEGVVGGQHYRIGSSAYVGASSADNLNGSQVFVSMNGEVIGYFLIPTAVRSNIKRMIDALGSQIDALLSGDKETQSHELRKLFAPSTLFFFHQSPHDKLAYIHNLQQNGKTVMMVGDGLNDSGALKQSDVGIAITDRAGVFSPACDGILEGSQLGQLDKFMRMAKSSIVILKTAFIISFFYNAIALTVAVSGHLTPLVAAILMPLSSISVVGFSTLAINFVAKRKLA